jgi:hypothetical protein
MTVTVRMTMAVRMSTVRVTTVRVTTMIVAMTQDCELNDVEEQTCPGSYHHKVLLDLRRVH